MSREISLRETLRIMKESEQVLDRYLAFAAKRLDLAHPDNNDPNEMLMYIMALCVKNQSRVLDAMERERRTGNAT